MGGINELLREGIISKLREFDAFIDNELPDYIMVMLANNKTVMEINQDLQLFLGDNTNKFTAWLQDAVANPDILHKHAGEIATDPSANRKRKKSKSDDSNPDKPCPQTEVEDEERDEDSTPSLKITPSLKRPKMRSDWYEEETTVRKRSERPSIKRYLVQSSRLSSKKTVRAQPDSTHDRDCDLRELIGSRQHLSGGRGTQQRQAVAEGEVRLQKTSENSFGHQQWHLREERDRGTRGQGRAEEEEEEGELEEDAREEEEEMDQDMATPGSTVASVVKLVERPRRTDVGGSRLLHRAILGLSKRSKATSTSMERGVVKREPEGEKVIILPASVLSDHMPKKIVLTKKQVQSLDTESHSQDDTAVDVLEDYDEDEDDDDDDDDKVIVNVDGGEGREFEEEFQVEGDPTSRKGLVTVEPFLGSAVSANITRLSSAPPTADMALAVQLDRSHEIMTWNDFIGLPENKTADSAQPTQLSPDPSVRAEVGSGHETSMCMDEQHAEEELESAPQGISVVATQGSKISVVPLSYVGPRIRRSKEEEVDLRDIINKSRKGKMEKISPRFVVTLSGAPNLEKAYFSAEPESEAVPVPTDEESRRRSAKDRLGTKVAEKVEQKEAETEVEETAGNGTGRAEVLERCRYWPNCKRGDSCPYHHPTVPCKLFPDCKYGKKCLYVHPQCKYNSRCTRVDCLYLHTAPRHLALNTQVLPQGIPTPIPLPQIFRPAFSPTYSYSSGGPSRRRPPRFPNKSAFSWKPSGHISERKFAVPEEHTTNISN